MDLKTFFTENPSVALGYSGGLDSSYLFYAARHYGARVKAYFIKTAFQPEFEFRDAIELAKSIGEEITVIDMDILKVPVITANPADRCYYCKKEMFGTLKRQAEADGFTVLIDGTNASDEESERPGMKALAEMSVRSPLRECGLTKEEIRRLSKEAGLFTWNKPAYACLATRIPTGREITKEVLQKVEASEDILSFMGFTAFRVRVFHEAARLQIPAWQMPEVLKKAEEIREKLKPFFPVVLLDLEER